MPSDLKLDLFGGPLDGLLLPAHFPLVESRGSKYVLVGTQEGTLVYRVCCWGCNAGGYYPLTAIHVGCFKSVADMHAQTEAR